MSNEIYPYLRSDLLKLILETPGVTSYKNFQYAHNGYYEVKIYDKFLYITFTETGLHIIIEAPESRIIPSQSYYHEDHYSFKPTDKIWLKNSWDSEELGNNTKILSLVDTPSFKNKYGFSFYTLSIRFKNLH